jgi:hypothetical protein
LSQSTGSYSALLIRAPGLNSIDCVEDHMRPLSLAVTVSMLRRALAIVSAFLKSSWEGPVGKYRPEDHYMRGPGPKWHEKHRFGSASAGGT